MSPACPPFMGHATDNHVRGRACPVGTGRQIAGTECPESQVSPELGVLAPEPELWWEGTSWPPQPTGPSLTPAPTPSLLLPILALAIGKHKGQSSEMNISALALNTKTLILTTPLRAGFNSRF